MGIFMEVILSLFGDLPGDALAGTLSFTKENIEYWRKLRAAVKLLNHGRQEVSDEVIGSLRGWSGWLRPPALLLGSMLLLRKGDDEEARRWLRDFMLDRKPLRKSERLPPLVAQVLFELKAEPAQIRQVLRSGATRPSKRVLDALDLDEMFEPEDGYGGADGAPVPWSPHLKLDGLTGEISDLGLSTSWRLLLSAVEEEHRGRHRAARSRLEEAVEAAPGSLFGMMAERRLARWGAEEGGYR